MYRETNGGWTKYEGNPVLGGHLGHCFDLAVLKEQDVYRMYFSWGPTRSIALAESADGIDWSEPAIMLGPKNNTGWEERVNRPVIVKRDGRYQMWYTGQAGIDSQTSGSGNSWIGYAESEDGRVWDRLDRPVLRFEKPWEKVAVMCPHVLWDEEEKIYRMWYSAGGQWEPDAIGYATSADGIEWRKHEANPIFVPDPSSKWDHFKVSGCQVIRHGGWHLMFYIGISDADNVWTGRIGIARSKDGISGWKRLPANPIISPGSKGNWDARNCWKPYAIYDKANGQWMLWYNGRCLKSSGKGLSFEQIGLATHRGEDLGF